MQEELWVELPSFPGYLISNQGCILNKRTKFEMRKSRTNYGHIKVALVNDEGRPTMSVAKLVAEAFVEAIDNASDCVIILNGVLDDLRAENLAWRPRHFAWKYTRQLKEPQPNHYLNLKVFNFNTGKKYTSVADCAMAEGLLFSDVWRSTYTSETIYPSMCSYRVKR